ncbi:hypothetical protein AAFF_G00155040 [Aldrovandia affinis]|uniref:Uncharacterized protein n=1 Tax=Aldrovandia affinis TaxID=143900 RepID=A0AAD7WW81_9TELE|nr:hypothetical protein AAFF_G00155040 [Aldrovandia affinis]
MRWDPWQGDSETRGQQTPACFGRAGPRRSCKPSENLHNLTASSCRPQVAGALNCESARAFARERGGKGPEVRKVSGRGVVSLSNAEWRIIVSLRYVASSWRHRLERRQMLPGPPLVVWYQGLLMGLNITGQALR